MTEEYLLRRFTAAPDAPAKRTEYRLASMTQASVGRDSSCEICIVDDNSVSRRHALLTYGTDGVWYIADDNSTNGTFVNGTQVRATPTALRAGDQVRLGQGGPLLTFERSLAGAAAQPGGALGRPGLGSVRMSEVLPFLSQDKTALMKGGYLWVGVVTVIAVVALFYVNDQQVQNLLVAIAPQANLTSDQRIALFNQSIHLTTVYNDIVGVYLCGALFYALYRLAGRDKAWYVLAGAAALTMVCLLTPIWDTIAFVFKDVLPGHVGENEPFSLSLLFRTFVGVGMPEELTKAIPILLAAWITLRGSPSLRERLGVRDPIDGVLIGAASALGFTMIETLGQYVPGQLQFVASHYAKFGGPGGAIGGIGFGEAAALELLLPRIISQVFGHVAYSGYFGYMIGLGMLHRKHFWKLALYGWGGAAALHALWDSTASLNSNFVESLIALVSFIVLLAAIRRARRVTGLSQPLGTAP